MTEEQTVNKKTVSNTLLIITAICVGLLLFYYVGGKIGAYRIIKMIRKAKTTEASLNLRQIHLAEVAYCKRIYKKNVNERTKTPLRFLTAPPTPRIMPNEMPVESDWNHPTWKALRFGSDMRTSFVYEIKATGSGFDSGIEIVIIGDLDSDGKTSLFSMTIPEGCCEKLAKDDRNSECKPVLFTKDALE